MDRWDWLDVRDALIKVVAILALCASVAVVAVKVFGIGGVATAVAPAAPAHTARMEMARYLAGLGLSDAPKVCRQPGTVHRCIVRQPNGVLVALACSVHSTDHCWID